MKKIKMMLEVIRFQSLAQDECELVFYSEGKNYWPYLKGLLESTASSNKVSICYVTSDKNDPGLHFKHPRVNHFLIDAGFIRNWFFANIKFGVVVMTMPDLNQFQVKRSTSPAVHYVYVQHSLVSLHMIYREGAFNHYDTVFCCGPHHVKELRAIEQRYQLPEKRVVENGYPFLDQLVERGNAYLGQNESATEQRYVKHILVAPTWGHRALIESGLAAGIVDKLLAADYKVTLRPHPETNKHSPGAVSEIVSEHSANDLFSYEANIVAQTSLFESDIMLCDWSGIALEYAFGLQKPVVFFDLPRKINNPNYEEFNIEPFEVSVRNKIGTIANLDNILDKISEIKVDKKTLATSIFNVGTSSAAGAYSLLDIVQNQP